MQSTVFNDAYEPEDSVGKLWLKRIALAVAAILLLLALGYGLKGLFAGHGTQKKPPTTIKLLPDTPPPPPPPPPKEPPKEIKEQPKEIKVEQPKPQQSPQPPVPEALKMEGAAGDGPSPFAAGPVNNEYKGGEVSTVPKIGGNKGLSAYAWYTGQIKARIEEALAAQKELTKAQYRLVVHVWLGRNGHIERAELQGSSGDQAIDEQIRKALAAIPPIGEAPPDDMPQPVKLRITSKNIS